MKNLFNCTMCSYVSCKKILFLLEKIYFNCYFVGVMVTFMTDHNILTVYLLPESKIFEENAKNGQSNI